MVAYLEKTDGNAEFHEIIDFLTRTSIHHALTVSPVVSTTFVEQFWTNVKSKIINNVRHITAKVAGKPVSIFEASIRSDLLFDNADGIDSLFNQAIFDDIQLMGICLNIDTWTSLQRINYMCLTAHYIDNDWVLRKKVLNFCPISSHRGVDIGKAVEMCLLKWGIESNVFTITVDNASTNDVAVAYLKSKFANWEKYILEGKWLHVRCIADVMNLLFKTV
ncbi:zinc finger BED domain-containing protein RICESLEEPER 2-like protein [Tanacetum coccineum]